MSANSKIQWCDATLNVFRGCLKVSEGCKNCYAITTAHQLNTRFKNADNEAARKVAAKYEGLTKVLNNGEKNWTGEVQVDYDTMMQPFKWKKGKRIFVNSMSDVFYEKISVADIAKLFHVMRMCRQHTFMILTKRPERMNQLLNSKEFIDEMRYAFHSMEDSTINATPDVWPLQNVWLGVSVENQATANERIPLLLSTPAHIRFLSMEPLLGEVDLTDIGDMQLNCLDGQYYTNGQHVLAGTNGYENQVNWVIVGGESGSKARPMNPLWVQKIQQDCEKANVPFFFKQWGEWLGVVKYPAENNSTQFFYEITEDNEQAVYELMFDTKTRKRIHQFPDNQVSYKIGKHKAGRLLNGKEFNEFPKT